MEYLLIPLFHLLILKIFFMKKLSLVTLVVTLVIFSACSGGGSTNMDNTDTVSSSMTMSNDSNNMNQTVSADTAIGNDARDFAKEAATGGMMEVELGNIAKKNSATQQVKDFGQMMVDDHTKINNQLKDITSVKNIDIPTMVTTDQQKDIDKLSKETGSDFDKDYVSMMIDDHKKDIDAFKKAGDKITDPDIKSFIANALPTLQKHLDAIQSIKNKM
jgi:putative membrane protein